jgi:signal transduction histidine kinase
MQIGKDSILIGTMDGVKLIRNKKVDIKFHVLGNNLINCIEYKKPFLLLGTNDRGLYIYNMQTRQMQHVSAKDGLASNIVYSVLLVSNQLWTGTGRGVNKYFFAIDGNRFKVSPAPLANLAFETNQNAILLARNSVWIGTTNGINVYPLNGNPPSAFTPKTVIQHVQTYTKNPDELKYLFSGGYRLPTALAIPSAESHISIKFQGIDFSSAKIQYQYMLEGLETAYSRPGENTFVDYPQLPPGKYVFKVKAIMPNGSAGDITSYAFTVEPAFYQTIAFKIFIGLLLISSVIGIFWFKSYRDRMERDFVSRLKLQEQEHVRRQTAEDFHDDLGNKLTRINMLSELLEKKMPHELTEQRKITEQIRSSAVEMYSGTKNILWALNPKNDNLSEITKELEKFGNSLFEGMDVRFKVLPCDGELSDIKLPLGYSHNVTLIFRELMNNILKHAHAKTVTFWCKIASYNQFCLMITDDGMGYCTNEMNDGHGLKNIHNRAQKLNGQLEICSKPGKGTSTKLIVTLT